MSTLLSGILAQLDPRIVYIVVAILVLSAILAIIKKAIKITIVVSLLAFGVYFLAPMATEFQENYKFNIENGVATIVVDGQPISIDKDTIQNIELVHLGTKGYEMKLKGADGISSTILPGFMKSTLEDFTEKYSISLEVRE